MSPCRIQGSRAPKDDPVYEKWRPYISHPILKTFWCGVGHIILLAFAIEMNHYDLNEIRVHCNCECRLRQRNITQMRKKKGNFNFTIERL